MKNLIICGDSFSVGIGCSDLRTQPYGSLLSDKLGLNLFNLAKGSSTNLSIFLQVKYAIENIRDIEYLIVGTTCYHRTEWFPENVNPYEPLNNLNVNYHQYPPYAPMTNHQIFDHPLIDDPRYKGQMYTENWYGVIDYVENILDKHNNVNDSEYFKKFKYERPERMRLLKDYYYEFFDSRIQRIYDMGAINMAHILLKKNNIKHIILSDDKGFNNYVSEENLIDINWGELSIKYPDEFKSLHTSPEGQKIVYEKILRTIEEG